MTLRPKFSTAAAAALVGVMVILAGTAELLGRTAEPGGRTVITVRLWDEQVAAAYRDSVDAFTRLRPDIDVRINLVSYASYFDTLRTDVAGGGADDIFWINNSNFAEYADNGRLMPVDPEPGWEPSVVGQFTRNGVLWGVPAWAAASSARPWEAAWPPACAMPACG